MWSKIVCIVAGIWLMASTALMQLSDAMEKANFIAGPLVLTFAVISLWEINSAVNKANAAIGAWLIVQPFILGGASTAATICSIATGIVLIVAALLTPKSKGAYGGGWRSLLQKEPEHLVKARG